ncbi:MAG: preprotein translocase subunit YajC [Verrucomicrobia bacterium]|nr:preprotein translocase subunit YajC [Verrucomicrobiota bacterium]
MTFLAFIGLFAAEALPGTGTSTTPPPMWTNLVPLALMIVVFYFLLIRPQQKQARQQDELRKALKKGDKIVTTSGILAIVVGVKEKSVSIRSDETKLEILKSAVAQVVQDFDKADPAVAPAAAKG